MLQEMNSRNKITGAAVMTCICLYAAWMACAQVSGSGAAKKESAMQGHASGPFDVKLSPQDDKSGDTALGRMTIDKQFHGDLEATSKGQMLSAVTQTKGSAGYVAIEKVSGKLHGRTGTFVLQHNATMTRGAPDLNIIVVPDSGTGELTGITGKMIIRIESGGKHFYDFEYTLPEKQQ